MFFIVEFKVVRKGRPSQRRLFRPNLPEIPSTERWVHCKVYHLNPVSIARARPDEIVAGGLEIPTYNGKWVFDSELDVWVLRIPSQDEEHIATLDMSQWSEGRYQGESSQPYRSAADGG